MNRTNPTPEDLTRELELTLVVVTPEVDEARVERVERDYWSGNTDGSDLDRAWKPSKGESS